MTQTQDRIIPLPNSTQVVQTRAGSVLVNSPPETLKHVLSQGIDPPQIILLAPDIPIGQHLGSTGFVHNGINYASVEFMLIANFFGQSRKTHIFTTTQNQTQRLRTILNETFEGPQDPAEYGKDSWLLEECRAVSYFPSLDRPPTPADLCTIASFEAKNPIDIGDGVTISWNPVEQEYIFYEDDVEVARASTVINGIPKPLSLAPPRPLQRRELTLQFIGGSDGFDPTGITTCFLAYLSNDVQTQATLFDTAAYLRLRLGNLGLSPTQVSEVVISHLHEDHLAGLPELILMGDHRTTVITSEIIYRSLVRVFSAMFNLPKTEVKALFDFLPLNPGEPLQIRDLTFESLYAVHTIPTIAVRVNGLYYSGDMRYDEEFFEELVEDEVLSEKRRDELIHFAEGAEILVQDAGGGAVHTTITPDLLRSLVEKGSRIVLAHTTEDKLPAEMAEFSQQIEIASSGHVTGMGESREQQTNIEVLETIEACPLFARLPFDMRVWLSQTVKVRDWAPQEVIVADGDAVDGSIYIVHSGLIEIIEGDDGPSLLIAGRGGMIGERGVLSPKQSAVRLNTVRARGACQLIRVEKDLFAKVAKILNLREAFNRAEWLWQQPLFLDILWVTMLDLALDFTPIKLKAGETLFNFGEPGLESYLLFDGKIDVYSEYGRRIDAITEPAEFFGGRAVLYNQLRNATAIAATDATVWSLPAEALHRLNMVYPHLILHMRAIEIDRTGTGRAKFQSK